MANKTPIKLEGGKLKQYASTDTVPASNVELDTDVTLAANSDTRIASQKAVKAYVAANGGVTTIYNGDGSLAADRTITLDGKILRFLQDITEFLVLDPTLNGENVFLRAFNATGSGNKGSFSGSVSDAAANFKFEAAFNGTAAEAKIVAHSESGQATLDYTADTNTFNGDVIAANLAGNGVGVASVDNDGKLSWSAGGGAFDYGKTIFISNANYVL